MYIVLGIVFVATILWAVLPALTDALRPDPAFSGRMAFHTSSDLREIFRDGATPDSIELDDSNTDDVISAWQMEKMTQELTGENYSEELHRHPGQVLMKVDQIMKQAAQEVWQARRTQEAARARADLPLCPECEERQIEPPDYLCKECRG